MLQLPQSLHSGMHWVASCELSVLLLVLCTTCRGRVNGHCIASIVAQPIHSQSWLIVAHRVLFGWLSGRPLYRPLHCNYRDCWSPLIRSSSHPSHEHCHKHRNRLSIQLTLGFEWLTKEWSFLLSISIIIFIGWMYGWLSWVPPKRLYFTNNILHNNNGLKLMQT